MYRGPENIPTCIFSVYVFEISSLQSSNRCAHLHESHRTLRDGSFGAALSPGTSCQATIAPSLRDISQQALAKNRTLFCENFMEKRPNGPLGRRPDSTHIQAFGRCPNCRALWSGRKLSRPFLILVPFSSGTKPIRSLPGYSHSTLSC